VQTGVTTRVSVAADGSQASIGTTETVIAAEGRFVAFSNSSLNLVPPQFLSNVHVYVRALTPGTGSVATYGTGCYSGQPMNGATISGVGTPHLGNASFAIGVGGGPASSVAVTAISLTQASTPFAGCTLLIGGAAVTLPTVFLNASGAGAALVPLPSTASLAGTVLYAQHFVLDSNGPFLGDFVLTLGLAVTLGS
jgi:hypothetical protein